MHKFLVDQNIPKSVSQFLKKQKCNVKEVKSVNEEMRDREIVQLGIKESRIILTNDKDFIDLAIRNEKANVLIFDLLTQDPQKRIDLLGKVLPKIKGDFGVLLLRD